ncbi:tyrosyl-tRNA ligase [Listeria fleischmannii 1991]|uniref:Tyrosine--tRNA ligase n=2 Tax=Listeria fleischmannii TaxID=1069827 RepID=A0A2X3HDQ9_9LIST|nr:tyrosine--tRNA ligase [Listeria fleischmannii]EMG29002.1 tyrosyl-tRNA ligase [Listeria fleischmannii subsp. fleischmannii LU2006-1]KMT60796.1 tyrosyl-tRNA ligase [Listeria fleischmannii 1991]SQC70687.1 Tyrosine--tRNA ligase [Listeria fleischmannii subsp. fleischmannii]
MNIIDELEWRGAVYQQTDEEGLRELTNKESISLYCGIDPTGDSMHIGHLIPFMILRRFQDAGHKPIILVGGATGTIGDPSGKKEERKLQSLDQINQNVTSLRAQLGQIFDFEGDSAATMVNNYDWTKDLSVLDFLRDFGKNFNVNTMLAKDIVASRLEVGISFTEFAYQILQAMDYNHLYEHNDCRLQIGGSDQWGNITAGLDLIRKKQGENAKAFGLTIPLLTKADGTKFGKTEGGAIWLNAEKTTPYEFYQFWINTDDRDVIKYLKYFTFLSQEAIADLARQVEEEPHLRAAQKTLAAEMTKFIHDEAALEQAIKISAALFSGDVASLTAAEIEQGFKDVPTFVSKTEEVKLVDWLVELGIEPSKRQSREDISNGAIYINGERIQDLDKMIGEAERIEGQFTIVRRGKKKYFLVRYA